MCGRQGTAGVHPRVCYAASCEVATSGEIHVHRTKAAQREVIIKAARERERRILLSLLGFWLSTTYIHGDGDNQSDGYKISSFVLFII